ncbi:hypothetical protein GQ53DRAFT_841097 [Thozetella sp. PMI_491]|nr:hypothetical protein GQ53DRAFT_841097 [Thozetella sp. PMI_491]
MDDYVGAAELMLYCCLNEIMERQVDVADDGHCPALEKWKRRWSHLLDIPHCSMLRLSYHFVYVIAIKREIELLKDGMKSANSASCGETPTPLEQLLVQTVCHHAKSALEHSLHVPASLVTGFSVFEYMNLAYSALTLLEFMPKLDSLMDETPDLLERVRAYYDDPTGNVRSVLWFASKKAKEACQALEKAQNHEPEIAMIDMLDGETSSIACFKEYDSLDDLNLRFPSFGVLFGDIDTDPITID